MYNNDYSTWLNFGEGKSWLVALTRNWCLDPIDVTNIHFCCLTVRQGTRPDFVLLTNGRPDNCNWPLRSGIPYQEGPIGQRKPDFLSSRFKLAQIRQQAFTMGLRTRWTLAGNRLGHVFGRFRCQRTYEKTKENDWQLLIKTHKNVPKWFTVIITLKFIWLKVKQQISGKRLNMSTSTLKSQLSNKYMWQNVV